MAEKVGAIEYDILARDMTKVGLNQTMATMRAFALRMGGLFAGLSLAKSSLKEYSDFVENASVLNYALGKDLTDNVLDSLSTLVRTSKTQTAQMAATVASTLRSRGVSQNDAAQYAVETSRALENIAAYYNATTERAKHAMLSMLAGMARPMERLTQGSIIPLITRLDEFTKATKGVSFEKLSPTDQMLARVQFFLQEYQKIPGVVGNSVNTLGTLKGQLDSTTKAFRDMKLQLGQTIQLFGLALAPILKQLFSVMKALVIPIIAIGAGFAAWKLGKLIVSLVKAIGTLWTYFSTLISVGIAETFAQTGIGAVVAVPLALGVVGAAVAAGLAIAGSGRDATVGNAQSDTSTPKMVGTYGNGNVTGAGEY